MTRLRAALDSFSSRRDERTQIWDDVSSVVPSCGYSLYRLTKAMGACPPRVRDGASSCDTGILIYARRPGGPRCSSTASVKRRDMSLSPSRNRDADNLPQASGVRTALSGSRDLPDPVSATRRRGGKPGYSAAFSLTVLCTQPS